MESWYPLVIGAVTYAYIRIFNWTAHTYLAGQKEDLSL